MKDQVLVLVLRQVLVQGAVQDLIQDSVLGSRTWSRIDSVQDLIKDQEPNIFSSNSWNLIGNGPMWVDNGLILKQEGAIRLRASFLHPS